VRVLTVDVEQHFTERTQLSDGARMPVDERARTAVPIDQPTHQTGALISIEAGLGKPRAHRRSRRIELELRTDFGLLRAAANHVCVAPLAQHERECVDQDGFARAGLAGQHGKARLEFELTMVDDDEVADRYASQHLGTMSCVDGASSGTWCPGDQYAPLQ
jgi:hypothetical protein